MIARVVSRRRRRVLALVIVVATLATAAWVVTRSPLLDVDHVQVRGNSRETPAEVLDAAGLHTGDPMVWIDTHQAAAAIETLPWVRRATVQREWPDTVRITVSERLPVAWSDTGSGALVLDAAGRVLAVETSPPVGLPQLLHVDASVPVGATIASVTAARVAGVMATFDPTFAASIELTDVGVLLRTPAGTEVRLGRATEVAGKIRAAIAVLGTPQADGAQYVDVSAPSTPVAG